MGCFWDNNEVLLTHADFVVKAAGKLRHISLMTTLSLIGRARQCLARKLRVRAMFSPPDTHLLIPPVFDGAWYRASYPEMAGGADDPKTHFLKVGAQKGNNPNPLFFTSWYLDQYPDVGRSGENPLLHYLRIGVAQGCDPNPLFLTSWYLEQYPDVRLSGENPLAHYLRLGAAEGRDPNPLFQTKWYLDQYPDVATSGQNPLAHYLQAGAAEGRNPNPIFETWWYLKRYPDVAQSGESPLAHYLRRGGPEGRDPSSLFMGQWYLDRYEQVAQSTENPLAHYLRVGSAEGCDPNPLFSTAWYAQRHSELSQSGEYPLAHYLRTEAEASDDPSPKFNTKFYKLQLDLEGIAGSPLCHALRSENPFRHTLGEVDAESAKARLGAPLKSSDAIHVSIGIVVTSPASDQIGKLWESAKHALSRCEAKVSVELLLSVGEEDSENSYPNEAVVTRHAADEGIAAGHNVLMENAFSKQARYYLAVDSVGAFHPDCIANLVRMVEAYEGRALIEAVLFPKEHPKFFNPETLKTSWASSACCIISRAIWGKTRGFDPHFGFCCHDIDLSWQVRRLGLQVMTCPTALFCSDSRFYPGPDSSEAWWLAEMLVNARYLGWKWGDSAFVKWAEQQLVDKGFATAAADLPPLPSVQPVADGAQVRDFEHELSFAATRWK